MTKTETPDATMRRAASLMLERADAMDAELATSDYWGWSSAEDTAEVYRDGVSGGLPGAAGALAGPWNPEANRALARWLQLEAGQYAIWGQDDIGHFAYALDVARNYLGEAPS